MTAGLDIGLPPAFKVDVTTTQGRGFTPEEVAVRCTDKIVAVAETAPEAIRDQARAYKKNVETVVAHYMREAIASDRTTVYNALADAGHPELAELIRRL
jgi:hypothetical protein